ncbi:MULTISPECIES: MarR family winged helix-turn-helix transcriptional regulator [unclassified Arthrobacter]|uniref:MarR family winged helix-turn-helix transcriptional regulator n=1 Tax=unclassified Arthrobacter TaxID=235627 RepID=UPI00159D219E|nr:MULTISPECIES: MarR family transcriptional regulator [unclassified Arthrobacter]MCQ9163513.1 MarR family transcriptional regulator [Arthrobacter sp. STN4]NVM99940.1 MarR family transcriptional regulator [Arthrobacter sp. SDTb3-6]
MPERSILKRQVCFSLYAASRAATAVYRPLLQDLGLTYPQYLVMLLLWEHDGVSVRELGEELELDSGTLSPLLKRLEAAGMLERRRTPDDERRVAVHLTPHGAGLREKALAVPSHIAAAAGLTPDGLEQLNATLAKVTAALHAHAKDPAP